MDGWMDGWLFWFTMVHGFCISVILVEFVVVQSVMWSKVIASLSWM